MNGNGLVTSEFASAVPLRSDFKVYPKVSSRIPSLISQTILQNFPLETRLEVSFFKGFLH